MAGRDQLPADEPDADEVARRKAEWDRLVGAGMDPTTAILVEGIDAAFKKVFGA
jgi:hypothetical protein